jgi:hypothetical protein
VTTGERRLGRRQRWAGTLTISVVSRSFALSAFAAPDRLNIRTLSRE